MSSLLDKYRQFKLNFYEKVFGLNTPENHLLDKDKQRSIIKTREQYFDIAPLLIFYSLYGLTNNLSAAVHKQPSVHRTPKPKVKSNSPLSSSGDSGSDSPESHDAVQTQLDSKPIESKANPQHFIDADFIVVSVLSIAELDEILEAKLNVAIPLLPEVVSGQFESLFIESFLPLTQLVSTRLDLSDIAPFSVLQDSMPVHQIWISGAVQISATEGGLLVSANALANALAAMGVLSVVNLEAILPAGISYDAGTSSFSFNPNEVVYNRLAEGQVLSVPVVYQVSDGTIAVDASVIFQITGVNDTPIVSGDFIGQLIEAGGLDNAILGGPSVSGQLFADDVDEDQSNRFQVKASALSDKAWGWYSVDANGDWTYSLDNSQPDVQALAQGVIGSDSFMIKTIDGTEQLIQVFITGSDDLASLSSAAVSLDETDAVLSTLGVLTISDFDSRETFVAQEATVGAYGVFTLTTAGAWNYTANSAFDNLVVGQQITDSFAVQSSDGGLAYVTVTIIGSNDAATISGTATAALTETDAALNASGTLSVADLDVGETMFVPQTEVVGSNGFGSFSINAAGEWTYSAGAHNEFKAGVDYTDSISVASVDGTAMQLITVIITGSNDAATISGTSTAALTESDMGLSVSGTLSVTDLDAGETVFVPQTEVVGSHDFGTFSINAAGEWTYSAGTHDEFKGGVDYTDSITVVSADGTATQVITVTITGVNDSALITGDIASQVVADNLFNQSSGFLIADDPDTGESGFKAETLVSEFGELIIDESGYWTYSVFSDLSAEQLVVIQQLGEGDSIPDVFTVQSIDATEQEVTINIFGINDPAELSASASGETNQGIVTEGSSVPAIGHISITDLDPGEARFIEQTVTTDYGVFTLTANGDWSYTLNLENADVKHLVSGEFLNDYFDVMSFDGSVHESITITINGVDDPLILDGPSYNLAVTDTDVKQSNTVNTGSDLLQVFNLSNPEPVIDLVASWSFDQQKTTDYGILYLNSASGLYEFVANKDAIQALSSKLLLLVDINIVNNENTIPTNIVITLTNSNISNDLFAGLQVTESNFSDLIDLSSLSAQYSIEDVSFEHGPGQDNYLVIDNTPVIDVVDLAQLTVLIDSHTYDLSI